MRCYFYTFGCKVNTCETAGIQQLLLSLGHTSADEPADADLAIINSCTVTASGDKRMLTYLKQLRKKNPALILVLTGCYAQAFPEEALTRTDADIIIGNHSRSRLPELIDTFVRTKKRILAVTPHQTHAPFELLPWCENERNTRAFLKIQDGCNSFCSYCIIPYARGRCRSMLLHDLHQQVQSLVQTGHREIVLCGINLAFYGKEWGGTLLDAVRCAADAGAERIRLGSLEPERITSELLTGLAEIPQFCPQFHLSLQSGCSDTLRIMNRRYTAAEYAAVCQNVRRFFPDSAITTDIMVGFPGETESDFAESLAFAERMQFAKIHVFRYSPRPGTPAAAMDAQVPEAVKTERMQQMQALGNKAQQEFLQAQVGRTVPVLFEREKDHNFHQGHAPNGIVIKIPQKNRKKSLRKALFYVTIEESDDVCCLGSLAPDHHTNPAKRS